MNYYIVTGASKGLGEAIVEGLLQKNHTIVCLSRTKNTKLINLAEKKGVPIHFVECDLSNIPHLSDVIQHVFSKINVTNAEKITLVNNAGMVNPIKKAGHAEQEEIITHVHLNLLAPMLLTEALIKETKNLSVHTVIVNITSGAANRPVPGWSIYCSTKAGVNMYTKTVGAEQIEGSSNITTIAFSPGIMDTEMQNTIRQGNAEDFSSIDQFREYHNQGLLRSAHFVAEKLINLLDGSLQNGRVYDIKEFLSS